jgi:hypothetical protein
VKHPLLWSATGLLFSAVAIGIALISAISADPLDTADKLSSIVIGAGGLIVGILSVIVAKRGSTQPAGDAWAVAAANDLAARVERQGRGEQHLRRLDDTNLLRVSWTSTARDVAASPPDVLAGGVGGRPTRLRLGGTIDDVGALFRRLPRRRLVVLGEPAQARASWPRP